MKGEGETTSGRVDRRRGRNGEIVVPRYIEASDSVLCFLSCRPTALMLLNIIKNLRKKYEDEFDVIQGKTKLVLLDEMQKENPEQVPNEDSIYQIQVS